MTDKHLRDFERRFRESGAAADEAAWLVERMRAGALPRDRIEVAAYCGDPVALAAMGDEMIARASYAGDLPAVAVMLGEPVTPHNLRAWFPGLSEWGRPVSWRASVAAFEVVLARYEAVHPELGSPRHLLDAASARSRRVTEGTELEVARLIGRWEALDHGEVGDIADDPLYRATWGLAYSSVIGNIDRSDLLGTAWAINDCGIASGDVHRGVARALIAWALDREAVA